MSDDKKPEVPATETKPEDDENALVPTEEIVADDGTGSKFALVQAQTGEEDEEVVWKIKSKAFRFDEGENEWKERGVGELKFLKSKADGKCRMLMRRDQILKVCIAMNMAEVGPLKGHQDSDKAFVLTGLDYSEDEEATRETICLKFGSPEKAADFQKYFVQCGGTSS